ncbi:MAG: GldG family protein [Burkholderiales bacterium]|nr:GldG family protein [Burkholderiales bacterium]MDP2397924.1 GldG family protein [Burkholderiales bacterium]
MQATGRLRWQQRIQSGIFVILLAVVTALMAYLAHQYRYEKDVTRNARNTLSSATLGALQQMQGPLRVTAYAVRQDAGGSNVHRMIEERVRNYQRVKRDLELRLVDPREQPKAAAEAGLRSPNALVIEYQRRSEQVALSDFNEQNFANALVRLLRGANSLVLWLDGHGERKLDGIANHDLGSFGQQLREKGFSTSSINLGLAQEVPANAALLVVTHPQVELQAGEVDKLLSFVDHGGNLLWLIDTEPLRGLQPLAEKLGLVLTPGTVIDPALPPRSGPPVFAVAANYARHPVAGTLQYNTLFPHARQVGADDGAGWRVTPLIDVAPRGWVETGKLDAKSTFDKSRDFPGPVNIATALERTVGDREQRVIVVGTGHFLSNSFIGNGGNLALGVSMMNWLAGEDALVTIDPRPAADIQLEVGTLHLYAIAAIVLLGLPLIFVLTGVLVWWRRRNAG